MNIICKLSPVRRCLVQQTRFTIAHRQPQRLMSSQKQSTKVSKKELLLMATQTGLLMGGGDLIAQVFVEKTPTNKLNWKRTAQFFGIGFVAVIMTICFF